MSDYWKLSSKFLTRRMSRRLALRSGLAAGVGLAGAALLGCGEEEAAPEAATATAAATSTAAAATTSSPGAARKKTLRVWGGGEPSHLDPHKSSGAPEGNMARLIYSAGLVRWDFDLQFKPDLAEKWDVSPDGLVYTFHMRQGQKFTNGKPVTAAVVVENFEAILDQKYGSFLRPDYDPIIKKVEATGEWDVKFTLKEPVAVFIPLLSHRTAIADMASFKPDQPMGAGPFILADWVRGSQIRLTKNPNYYRADHVLVEEVIRPFGTDVNVPYNALRAGEMDIASISTTFVKDVKQKKDLAVYEGWGSPTHILFNMFQPPFNDFRMRQAVDLAINRDDYIQGATDGTALATVGYFFPGHPYYVELPVPKRDVAKAKQLVKEAGFEGFSFDMPHYNSTDQLKQAEVFQAHMKEIGINIRIVPVETATLFSKYLFCPPTDGKFLLCDMLLLLTGWTTRPDPDVVLYPQFRSGAGYNRGDYRNQRMDELLDKARLILDAKKRKELYDEAQRIIREELPRTVVYYSKTFEAASPKVKGYPLHPSDPAIKYFEDVYVEA